MIRVCLDSNVLVAAFAARGLCSDLLAHVLSEQHLVVPDIVREESLRVLTTKFRLSAEAIESVAAVLDRCEAAAASAELSPVALRDPDDEKVLADAVAAGVQVLVTGDKDLLEVAEQSPISILSPRAFMMLTRGGAL
ncbi:MAG: putative toxin-antitoxin system toxin component, PIN family [Gemmatimonadota bacterium]|nr:putative toxin-antitoxin system toxin component, PIN family [Gemmatimonadota bacterium]